MQTKHSWETLTKSKAFSEAAVKNVAVADYATISVSGQEIYVGLIKRAKR